MMYEIWSLGHKPYESYTNPEVIIEERYGKLKYVSSSSMLCYR